jgi:hypothetical protein
MLLENGYTLISFETMSGGKLMQGDDLVGRIWHSPVLERWCVSTCYGSAPEFNSEDKAIEWLISRDRKAAEKFAA